MGDGGFPAHSPLLFQTQETSVWRDKLLILSFPVDAPLFPLWMHRALQPLKKILQGALDDALSYLIPFRAREGWAHSSQLPQQLHVPDSNQDEQGILSWCPPSTRAAADTEIQGIFQSKKETSSSC